MTEDEILNAYEKGELRSEYKRSDLGEGERGKYHTTMSDSAQTVLNHVIFIIECAKYTEDRYRDTAEYENIMKAVIKECARRLAALR